MAAEFGHRFSGIPASPGIAIGNAVLVEWTTCFDQFHVPEQEVVPEQKRLRNALTTAGRELSALQERVVEDGGEHPYILEAQILMLQDPLFVGGAMQLIQDQRINAEWAIQSTGEKIEERFDRLEESFFRERKNDIASLIDRVLEILGVDSSSLDAAREEAAIPF